MSKAKPLLTDWRQLEMFTALVLAVDVNLMPDAERLRNKVADWLVWRGHPRKNMDGFPVWPRHQLAARGIYPYIDKELNTEFFMSVNYDVRIVVPPLLAVKRAKIGDHARMRWA